MKKYDVSSDTRDVLDILIKQNDYISLNKIINILDKKPNYLRTLQKIIKELKDNQRVIQEGKASLAKVRIENIQRSYRRYDFIYVVKNNQAAGIIFKLDDMYRFYYLSDYIADGLPAITLLNVSISPYDFKEIPALFEEDIPEGINREILETAHKTSDEFELLTLLSDNIGDLSFTKTLDDVNINKAITSPSYLSIQDAMLGTNKKINVLSNFKINIDEEFLFPESHDLTKLKQAKNDGISGFQYKKLVNIDFEKKEIYDDGNITHHYILKPYSKIKSNKNTESYFPHIALNEHLFMSFAKNELGFKVPYSAIVKTDNSEYHYVVKRFDRYKLSKYAKSTFAVYMGLRSDNKYDTSSEKLFTRIAKELISPHQRMELLKHYVYSVIIQHEDMHTKNLSLIIDKGKVLFSPLYDIACTGIYSTTKKLDSHISINSKQTNIRPNDFKVLCKILNIKYSDFKKEAFIIANTYKNGLPLYLDEIDKLGSIPFYKMKQSVKIGEGPIWKAMPEAEEFSNILRKFYNKRVIELTSLGWINTTIE